MKPTNIAIGCLSGLAFVLLVVATIQQMEIGRLRAEVVRQKANQQLAEVEGSTKMALSPREKPANSASPRAQENFSETMKVPQLKKTVLAQIRAQKSAELERTHPPLYSRLQLTTEELNAFKELLLERESAIVELGIQLQNASASEKTRAFGDLFKKYDAQIHTFLNDEKDYGAYLQFEASVPEREQLAVFQQDLGAGDQLTQQQTEALLSTIQGQRNTQVLPTEAWHNEVFYPPELTPEAVSAQLQVLSQLRDREIAAARPLLTETQLEQFQRSLNQLYTRQEAALRAAMQPRSAPASGTR